MRTAEELESISNSFDKSLHTRLWALTPASASLPWLSSAVDANHLRPLRGKILDLRAEFG
ncbi:uncharacterized protein J3R85_006687 [Psidium guajava]|nr:uncharacterized protein J3R85_006687 [Psidium guajava]